MKQIAETIDIAYQGVARFFLGILGGIIYWVAPGVVIATLMLIMAILFGSPKPSFLELLILWTVTPMIIGAVFGQYYKMGGGLLSGVLVGAILGWLMSGWRIWDLNDISGGSLSHNLVAIFEGVIIGGIGGAIGGGISAIARQNPISPYHIDNMKIINAFAIPGFIIFGLYLSTVSGLGFHGEKSSSAGLPFLCLFYASPLISLGAFAILKNATPKYFETNKQLINGIIIETATRNLWKEFFPLFIGLITEVIVRSLSTLFFKSPVFGLGGLLGAVAGAAIQEIWKGRKDRAFFQIMAFVVAAFLLELIKLHFNL